MRRGIPDRRLLLSFMAMMVAGTLVIPGAAQAADYPARDSRYHSYPEMVRHIKDVAAAHPGIVRIFSIGRSYEGRRLWAAEVSDNVGQDEGEPEVFFDGLHHAREHLTAEMAIYILDLLADRYGGSTALARKVTRLVDTRRTWIVFMVNPDGLQYDLNGSPYRSWRKNRQPTPGSRRIGTDLNRNYGYRWGCCGASSRNPGAWDYRGPRAWSTPEARAVRDFVQGRVVRGRQRIRAHITFHTAGELVLWPFAYTRRDLPRDMTALDLRAFRALGRDMAASNRYRAKQSSAMYPTDGDQIDWMYARQRIFSFTFEMYPRGGAAPGRHYPPDERIGRETRRNRDAVLYLMSRAACPYAALGATARQRYCGPFYDDLEIGRGWRVDPGGGDGATDGRWARGKASRRGLQLGSAASGQSVLVTGRRGGHDVDRGRTTVRSPLITIPAAGGATLHLHYWVGLSPSAGQHDGLRVQLVGPGGVRLATLATVTGERTRRAPRWRTLKRAIPAELAGQRVAIQLVAVDEGRDSIVEVGVDDVRITAR
jgi:murein tripeptide amidase MpaA